MAGRYRRLFNHHGAVALAVTGLVGRLPIGMLNLAFILTVVEATGSYATGGLAAAAYTLTAAVTGPLWSRAADRLGPRAMLLITGVGQATVLCAVAAAASSTDNRVLLVLLSGAGGLMLPPLGPIMRSTWSKGLERDADSREAAFALESIATDLIFIGGPSLVAGLSALAHPVFALLAAAGLTLAGCLGVAANRRVRPAGEPSDDGGEVRHWLGPLRYRAVVWLLPISFLLFGSIAAIEVSLVSFADHLGRRDTSGLLIAVLSVGGVIGGLYWGSRKQPGTSGHQLVVLLGVLTSGWALLALLDNVWLLGGFLVLAGLILNPAITASFSTMDDVAPRETLTEAFGWINSSGAAGLAAGAALAGTVVDSGAGGGFVLAAGMCALASASAFAFLPKRSRGLLAAKVDAPAERSG